MRLIAMKKEIKFRCEMKMVRSFNVVPCMGCFFYDDFDCWSECHKAVYKLTGIDCNGYIFVIEESNIEMVED